MPSTRGCRSCASTMSGRAARSSISGGPSTGAISRAAEAVACRRRTRVLCSQALGGENMRSIWLSGCFLLLFTTTAFGGTAFAADLTREQVSDALARATADAAGGFLRQVAGEARSHQVEFHGREARGGQSLRRQPHGCRLHRRRSVGRHPRSRLAHADQLHPSQSDPCQHPGPGGRHGNGDQRRPGADPARGRSFRGAHRGAAELGQYAGCEIRRCPDGRRYEESIHGADAGRHVERQSGRRRFHRRRSLPRLDAIHQAHGGQSQRAPGSPWRISAAPI